jgi:hypothetical protein
MSVACNKAKTPAKISGSLPSIWLTVLGLAADGITLDSLAGCD